MCICVHACATVQELCHFVCMHACEYVYQQARKYTRVRVSVCAHVIVCKFRFVCKYVHVLVSATAMARACMHKYARVLA